MVGEKIKGIKPCPFCSKIDDPFFTYTSKIDKNEWVLSHTCNTKSKEPHFTVNINVYGASEKEVIEKWNNRAKGE